MKGRLLGLAVVIGLGVALLGAQPASAAEPSVHVGDLTSSVGLGGKVTVEARDILPPGLSAWTFDISYDSSIVMLKDCGAEHGGICNPAFGEETLRISGVNIGGLEGDTVLGAMEFTCKAEGEALINLEIVILADATLGAPQPIDADAVAGKVTCLAEGEEPPAPPPGSKPGDDKLPGDADCDGTVTAIDAALVLQYSAGLKGDLPCPDDADADGNGNKDAIDAALMLQMSAGLL